MKGTGAGNRVLESWVDWRRFLSVAADCDWTPGEFQEFYVGGTREQLAEIGAAIAAADGRELERLAHGCVGSSSTCGLPGMAEIFRSMETAARDGRLDDYADLAERAERRLRQVERALTEQLADRSD